MPLSNDAKDMFIAPGMSAFTSASIEDLSGVSPERDGWVTSFLLNSIFRGGLAGPVKATLLNFLRRTHSAFGEYGLARSRALAYLAAPDTVMEYLAAISHWEGYLSQAYQAYCLLDMGKRQMFSPGDGTGIQRLCHLYNRSKHVEKAITSGQLTRNETLAVWLTNDGLNCTDSHLTYIEAAGLLRHLASIAEAVEDPVTMREKLTALASR